MSEFQDYERLLSDYVDGILSAEQIAELERLLAADEAFVEHCARWCLTHRQIADLFTESALHEMMDRFVQTSPGLPRHALSQLASTAGHGRSNSPRERGGLTGGLRQTRTAVGRRGFRWLAVAGAAAVLGLAAWFGVDRSRRPAQSDSTPNVTASGAAQEKPAIVAALTQLANAVWAEGAPRLQHGQELAIGSRIALQSGLAKVTFDCGAEVVLAGPCDFEIREPMIGYLRHGKIAANVPRRAFRFAILSRDVDFIDLGTSFGVTVGSSGPTELHVFEGEVLCSQTKQPANEPNDVIHVTADTAMSFGNSGAEPNKIAMNEQQFAGLISLRRAAHEQPRQLATSRLALWLAADVAVTTDREQRVISWQDILYGDNHSAEDAIQENSGARPILVSDAINGRRGIRFNGTSDFLLTTPLETTDDQTVLFVCQFSPSAYDKDREWGGQILNYDGPPSRYLSNTLEPGVLQIGEPLLAKDFKPTLLTGQVFAGFIGKATVEAGRIDAEQVGANVPIVVAYRYDFEHGVAELFINGRSFGKARAFAPQGITSRKIIGRHAWKQLFFHGDLGEMLIYNKALTPGELADTTAYLAGKYAIDVATGPLEPGASTQQAAPAQEVVK